MVLNIFKAATGIHWGAHPDKVMLVYKGLEPSLTEKISSKIHSAIAPKKGWI